MTVHANDIWRRIGFLEEDARRTLANLGELRRLLAAVELPKPQCGIPCPVSHCGLEQRDEAALINHLFDVHGQEAAA